jgi:hypothetical protein
MSKISADTTSSWVLGFSQVLLINISILRLGNLKQRHAQRVVLPFSWEDQTLLEIWAAPRDSVPGPAIPPVWQAQIFW